MPTDHIAGEYLMLLIHFFEENLLNILSKGK
jgi:hypothetical protein